MAHKPTDRVTFDADALTDDQRDGFACVVCRADLATAGPSVPVGTVPGGLELLGGQVFACASHLTAGQRDGLACVVCGLDYLAEATPTPHVPVGMVDGGQVFACSWHVIDGSDVDPAESDGRHAEAAENVLHLAGRGPMFRRLADEVRQDGQPDVADALTVAGVACDRLRAVLDEGGDLWAAVADVHAAMSHGGRVVRAARAAGDTGKGDVS